MSLKIILIFLIAVSIRLISLIISKQNEKKLKLIGAVEYGKLNTSLIMISHSFFFLFAFIEGFLKKTQFDIITELGALIYLFSGIILCIVILQLGRFWTFKLIIASNHILNKSFIFRYFRHPNYFLNVIPELIAIILICKAWFVFMILFPIHLALIIRRIIEEETVMKQRFIRY